jgi:hypothetical protein
MPASLLYKKMLKTTQFFKSKYLLISPKKNSDDEVSSDSVKIPWLSSIFSAIAKL